MKARRVTVSALVLGLMLQSGFLFSEDDPRAVLKEKSMCIITPSTRRVSLFMANTGMEIIGLEVAILFQDIWQSAPVWEEGFIIVLWDDEEIERSADVLSRSWDLPDFRYRYIKDFKIIRLALKDGRVFPPPR